MPSPRSVTTDRLAGRMRGASAVSIESTTVVSWRTSLWRTLAMRAGGVSPGDENRYTAVDSTRRGGLLDRRSPST